MCDGGPSGVFLPSIATWLGALPCDFGHPLLLSDPCTAPETWLLYLTLDSRVAARLSPVDPENLAKFLNLVSLGFSRTTFACMAEADNKCVLRRRGTKIWKSGITVKYAYPMNGLQCCEQGVPVITIRLVGDRIEEKNLLHGTRGILSPIMTKKQETCVGRSINGSSGRWL